MSSNQGDPLQRALDRIGQEEREEVQQALDGRALEPGPAEEALRAAMRSAARPPRRRLGWVAAAAAAFVVALGVKFLPLSSPPQEHTGNPALGRLIQLEAPVGASRDFGEFRWRDQGSGANRYHLTIYRVERDQRVKDIDLRDVRGTSWRPTPEQSEAWAEIYWTVSAYRGTGAGDLIESVSARASR